MSENQEYTIEEIDNLIRINKETIEDLQRNRRMCNGIQDDITVSKSITRITEGIRKLLRIRMKLIKESKNYKPKGGAENESK